MPTFILTLNWTEQGIRAVSYLSQAMRPTMSVASAVIT
jgi:hypothetical protein